MENKKVVALLNSMEGENVTNVEVLNDTDIVVNDTTWKVLTDKEADLEFREYQMDLLEDLGIEAFSDWAKDYVLRNCIDGAWFDEAMRESFEAYIEDLNQEELEEELNTSGVIDEEELLDYYCNDWDNGIDWYIINFGEEELFKTIKKNNLYDLDKIIEFIKETDGRDCLATYDGEETELENGYYAYRID